MWHKETYVGILKLDIREIQMARARGYEIEFREKEALCVAAGLRLLSSDAEITIRWRTRYLDMHDNVCDEDSIHLRFKEISLYCTVMKD